MYEDLAPRELPEEISFFTPDLTKYPNMKEMTKNILDVSLEPGDCLYLPELYYYQSRTLTEESTILTLNFSSASVLTNLLFMGIESADLLDE